MKRSEMIGIISDLLEELYSEHQPIKIADMFLIEMERHGMLPPLNDGSLHTDGDKANADNVRYYTWEPEDE